MIEVLVSQRFTRCRESIISTSCTRVAGLQVQPGSVYHYYICGKYAFVSFNNQNDTNKLVNRQAIKRISDLHYEV